MKHYLSVLIACLCVVTALHAQSPNTKWGKPAQTEWSLVAWGEAPDAEAIILNKTTDVSYRIARQFSSYSDVSTELNISSIEFMGNSENSNVTVTYDNKLRVKILKDSGIGYANIDIVYLNDEKDSKIFDELDRVKVTVFSQNEKGKISRRYLKNDTFKTDRLNAHYNVLHIQVPDAKKGDIIEYQYTITSSRTAFIYDCSFQEDIPILYAKCEMNIPAFLQFDMAVPVHPYVKSKVERGAIHGEQSQGDMQAPKSYPSNHYQIEGHDILPTLLDSKRENFDPAKMKVAAKIKSGGAMQPVALPDGVKHIGLNAK